MAEANQDSRAGRTALVAGGAFLLLGTWDWLRGGFWAPLGFGVLGAFLLCAGWCMPPVARRFHGFWMGMAAVLGRINTCVLLALVYYGVMTPLGLALRLVGRDPLDRRRPPRNTYWIPRNAPRQAQDGFERLF